METSSYYDVIGHKWATWSMEYLIAKDCGGTMEVSTTCLLASLVHLLHQTDARGDRHAYCLLLCVPPSLRLFEVDDAKE